MVEDDIKGEVVLHSAGFYFFFFQKVESCRGKPVSIDVKNEIVFVHNDFTFQFFFCLTLKFSIFSYKFCSP